MRENPLGKRARALELLPIGHPRVTYPCSGVRGLDPRHNESWVRELYVLLVEPDIASIASTTIARGSFGSRLWASPTMLTKGTSARRVSVLQVMIQGYMHKLHSPTAFARSAQEKTQHTNIRSHDVVRAGNPSILSCTVHHITSGRHSRD